jgi:exosortase/archaeosortase family protein
MTSTHADNRAAADRRGAVSLWRDPAARFAVAGALLFGLLSWLFRAASPIPGLASFVRAATEWQAAAAAFLLRATGQSVERQGLLLAGGGFACEVGEGCNGFIALALAASAVLAWPVPWRRRFGGLLWMVPAVVVLNVGRIAGLWWMGRHRPDWFDLAHVYVGQVVVIVGTVAAWGIWLSWNEPRRRASS